MPRLIVKAVAARDPAITAGTQFRIEVVVSVSDENGNPVNGLARSHFAAERIAGPTPQIQILDVTERSDTTGWEVDGFYTVDVGPAGENNPWHDAGYVCALVVSRSYTKGIIGTWPPRIVWDRGQTLFKIDMSS
ncbi:MAG TPA: hypothetical protein VGJ40_00655 [Gaiellaceae bacterium]|jgi:hypothetical protein